ncbi:hypothetical protein BRC90_01755 [Halobacteriales archaeon QS_4_69_34]|nr:MAG: hypothetical protein BRC90_01755 [Halobacteriales archaeon QS_4_69_34]
MDSSDMAESQVFYKEFFSDKDSLEYNNRERYETVFDLVDSLDLPRQSAVLDVGSGSGRIADFLADRFDTVHSVDIVQSDALIERLTRRPEMHFVQGALPDLPVTDGCFDLVVCSEVIEHLPRGVQPKAIRELGRVMANDGHGIFSTPNPQSYPHIVKSSMTDVLATAGLWERPRQGGQPIENWLPPTTLRTMLRTEFAVERALGSYYLPPPINRMTDRFSPLRVLRRGSEAIRRRGWLSNRGLYQYYVVCRK